MTNVPAVSVIVPIYKVERYIKFCIDSILMQSFQDFEIILIDDASPDGSVELCQKLYGDNDKIKFVRHERNLGLGSARNTGIKHARGKYIAFVDSDDFILPDALEKFYNTAEKNNAQVVHAAGWLELTQDEVEPILEKNLKIEWAPYTQEGFIRNDPFYRLTEHWDKYKTHSMTWLHFCRRDFLIENGIEFLPIISEDETFSFAVFCKAERYYIVHDALYVYRKRSGSIMKAYTADRLAQGIDAMLIGMKYIDKFLDELPRVEGYDFWRETIRFRFFIRLLENHSEHFYKNFALSREADETIKQTLSSTFGVNTPFVRFFFNELNLLLCQYDLLIQRNNELRMQIMTAFAHM